MMSRQHVLRQALAARREEVLSYQINIDNYKAAITSIAANYPDNADLSRFRADLSQRLQVEREQQLRAIVIRDVIDAQVMPSMRHLIGQWLRRLMPQ